MKRFQSNYNGYENPWKIGCKEMKRSKSNYWTHNKSLENSFNWLFPWSTFQNQFGLVFNTSFFYRVYDVGSWDWGQGKLFSGFRPSGMVWVSLGMANLAFSPTLKWQQTS